MRISISDRELLKKFQALLENHSKTLQTMGNDNLKTVIIMCARNGIKTVDEMLTDMESVDRGQ